MGNTVRTVGSPATPNDRGFPPTVWSQVDWKKAERSVQNLRFRIFRAAKEQRGQQVRNLTKLLLRSYADKASLPVNRLERHAGKLARAVLRGRGPGDRLLLPDPPLCCGFRQRLMPSVRSQQKAQSNANLCGDCADREWMINLSVRPLRLPFQHVPLHNRQF